MQQLQAKLKNVPTDTSQVCCSTSTVLNKEETLSEPSIVLTCNNLDVNQLQHTGGKNLRVSSVVYVVSMRGLPLMPTSPSKARKLLTQRKAVVWKRYPFTVKLLQATGEAKQEISFGIDSGYQNIGFSAITGKKEAASGEMVLDGKTSERLTERSMYRRGRRNKLWYRKPRFNNRSTPSGWLPPSTQRRYDTHLNILNRYKQLLPITTVTIETAKFDIQKINNPSIEGIGYQQGSMYEYQNIRSYLMSRERGLCQLCKKKFENGNPSHIHHCKPRSEAGSNKPSNLAILHKKCHEKLHAKGLKISAPKSMKPETFMSIIHNKFIKDIPDVKITFGYKTFVDRNNLSLEKTHYTDAFVIAGGTTQSRTIPIVIKQKHRNSRVLQTQRNGFAPAIRRQRYSIQPKDLVWVKGKRYSSNGTHCKGTQVRIENTKKSIGIKHIEKVYHFGSFIFK